MLYRDKRTRRLPPTVRQVLTTPFASRQLIVFGQRKQFSDPAEASSYDVTNGPGRISEILPQEIQPVDVLRGSRNDTESLVNPAGEGPPTTNSTSTGGGGSPLTGTGITNRLTKWTGAQALGSSIVTELSGKIGIGISSPLELLHVDGKTRTTALKIATTVAPTTGYVWTATDTLGNGSWQAAGGGSVAWGSITGTLSSQTDLQNALNAKASKAFAVAMGAAL